MGGIPPHLWPLLGAILLILFLVLAVPIGAWLRRRPNARTPEQALQQFLDARNVLLQHRKSKHLSADLAAEMDDALRGDLS